MKSDKLDDKYFEEIKKANKLFVEISNRYHFEIPKPINLEEEKKTFLNNFNKGKVYNPQIEFDLKKFYLTDFYKMRFKLSYLLHVEEDEKDYYGIKTLYKNKLYELYNKINYHDFWGEKESTEFIKNCYGKPGFFLVFRAKWFCRFFNQDNKSLKQISEKEIGKSIKSEVLKTYKDKVKVSYKNSDFEVKFCESKKEFLVNNSENVKFYEEDILRLKLSEVDVVYRRFFNGIKSKVKLFEVGTKNSLETEVGLKLYYESVQGVLSKDKVRYYAGLCIASRYCLSKSFYKVFKILKKFKFTDQEAFDITFRVKRNLFDTSKKGGFTKDYLFYSGFLKVQKFSKNKKGLRDLFIGRIGIDDLKVIDKFITDKEIEFESPFDVEIKNK
mgnify:CR=1 FL=1